MVSFAHDKESCKQIEGEILTFIKDRRAPISLEEVWSEFDGVQNPKQPYYEVFHHTYHLVDKGDLMVSVRNPHQINVFTARR